MPHPYATLHLTFIRGCVANKVGGLYVCSSKGEAPSNLMHSVRRRKRDPLLKGGAVHSDLRDAA